MQTKLTKVVSNTSDDESRVADCLFAIGERLSSVLPRLIDAQFGDHQFPIRIKLEYRPPQNMDFGFGHLVTFMIESEDEKIRKYMEEEELNELYEHFFE